MVKKSDASHVECLKQAEWLNKKFVSQVNNCILKLFQYINYNVNLNPKDIVLVVEVFLQRVKYY